MKVVRNKKKKKKKKTLQGSSISIPTKQSNDIDSFATYKRGLALDSQRN